MALWEFMTENSPLSYWLMAFVISGLVLGVVSGFFRARKIQPNGFNWRTFRNEAFFGAVNVAISGALIAYLTAKLSRCSWRCLHCTKKP